MPHSTLYTVDNSTEDQSVRTYLKDWCSVSKQMDIATGYLEVGGLLSLDGDWQKLDKIRIILGNEVTQRTHTVISAAINAITDRLKNSVDMEQEKNEFLFGVPAILDALKTGKIECRVFDKSKFHAKAYITYFRDDYRARFIQSMNVPAGYALVGSSNFTKAGLTQNIELNVQIKDNIEELQEWFDIHWEQGVDITEAILADTIYRNRENRAFCKEHGIRLSGPKLGRPKKDGSDENDAQAYQDSCDRNMVEGRNGIGKRRYGLDLIMAYLAETGKTEAAFIILAMNVAHLLRFLLALFWRVLKSVNWTGESVGIAQAAV